METPPAKKELIAIGYWISYTERDLPDIRNFVAPHVPFTDRQMLVAYLKKQREFEVWRGWSYCRFDCGIADEHMGHSDYSDGTYVWPQGLPHYIDAHEIWLPAAFVEHVAAHINDVPDFKKEAYAYNYDYSWWKSIRQLAG